METIEDTLIGPMPPTVMVSVNLDHVHHFASAGTALPTGTTNGTRWLALLDGRPVAAAVSRRIGRRAATMPGSELLAPVLDIAAAHRVRVGLVGGSEATRMYWRDVLPQRFPGIVEVGAWPVEWAELDQPGGGAALAAEVAQSEPTLLVVSLGKPRQEIWLRDHMAATGAKLALPFGSAVDYLAGTATRPPAWARRLGLEWLVRLVREPRRLAYRYLVTGPVALLRVSRDTRLK